MARSVSKTPRAVADTKQTLSELFSGEHIADPALDTDNTTVKAADDGVDVKSLQEQIGRLSAQVDQVTRLNTSLMTRQVEVSPTVQKEPQLDLVTNMPDPMYHQAEYNTEVSRRTSAYTKDIMAYQNAVAAQENSHKTDLEKKSEGLWEDFRKAHADYADNEDRVLFAAQKVADKARARGIDVQTYMFNNRDQFMTDLTSEMDTIFGKPGADAETGKGATTDDEPANRTTGLFGAHGAPMPRTPETNRAASGDMIEEIRDMQRKSGLY